MMAEISKFNNEPQNTQFSWYGKPVTNLVSKGTMTLVDAYLYIKGNMEAWQKTLELRKLTDAKEHRAFKAKNFDYVLFSGVFNARKDEGIVVHSGLLCIDFDHLGYMLDSMRERLIHDRYFKTWLLFRSPSGDGLKWVIGIDLSKGSHEKWFRAIQNYIHKAYLTEIDSQCVNVSRACFLPCDPNVYAAPEIINQIKKYNNGRF